MTEPRTITTGTARRLDEPTIAGIGLGTFGVALVAGTGTLAGKGEIVWCAVTVISEIGFAWGLNEVCVPFQPTCRCCS